MISAGVDLAEMGRPPPECFRCVGTEVPRVAVLARVDDFEGSRLASGLDDAFALVAGRFFRREVRAQARARACVAGMLSGLERKTGWSLAEHAGEASPDGMQRLFTVARWDAALAATMSAATSRQAQGARPLISDDAGQAGCRLSVRDRGSPCPPSAHNGRWARTSAGRCRRSPDSVRGLPRYWMKTVWFDQRVAAYRAQRRHRGRQVSRHPPLEIQPASCAGQMRIWAALAANAHSAR